MISGINKYVSEHGRVLGVVAAVVSGAIAVYTAARWYFSDPVSIPGNEKSKQSSEPPVEVAPVAASSVSPVVAGDGNHEQSSEPLVAVAPVAASSASPVSRGLVGGTFTHYIPRSRYTPKFKVSAYPWQPSAPAAPVSNIAAPKAARKTAKPPAPVAKSPPAPLSPADQYRLLAYENMSFILDGIKVLFKNAPSEERQNVEEYIDRIIQNSEQDLIRKKITTESLSPEVVVSFELLMRKREAVFSKESPDGKGEAEADQLTFELRKQVLLSSQEISLANHKASELSDGIGAAYFAHTIDLSNNSLSQLPDIIVRLPMLHTLRVQNNQLAEVPRSLVGIPGLKIYAKGNLFTSEYVSRFNQLAQRVFDQCGQQYGISSLGPVQLIVDKDK